MNDLHDLELLIRSHVPILLIESHEEPRVLEMFRRLRRNIGKPVFSWTITDGLLPLEMTLQTDKPNVAEPDKVLRHIKQTVGAGVYLLLDFHPYLDDPLHVRLLKEIAMGYDHYRHHVVLVSYALDLPPEIQRYSARFELGVPDSKQLDAIVREEAVRWARDHGGKRVKSDSATLQLLVKNLSGMTAHGARTLARNAIYDDGAITRSDMDRVNRAKYELLDMGGVMSYEYDTTQFAEVGGLARLKAWLEQRRPAFVGEMAGVEVPKGLMLLGVQGSGKSLAAKAVAGSWGIPLLQLDFGALYNKFFGETERNLRSALELAAAMSPCVLWVDEIEKGLGADGNDSGTSKRVLGTLLTWMAERNQGVFIVATANDISALPPELMRKGRLDEIFFVDLPDADVRAQIFRIHLRKRKLTLDDAGLERVAAAAEGFSGAEIEQAVVAALYSAAAREGDDGGGVDAHDLLDEINHTRPLSVVMADDIAQLRAWAENRTVPAN